MKTLLKVGRMKAPETSDASFADGRVRVRIKAVLLEDTHLGSGAGGGGIDALVARDRYGRPVIWSSHLEGVLRDAARRLYGEDKASALFGRAGGQQQSAIFTSLYQTSESPDASSRIWRSTARASFYNRAPRDDTLRVIECIPKGECFEGLAELPRSHLDKLKRLLQEVDALGGGRATGSGRVALSHEEEETPAGDVGEAKSRLILLLRNLDPLCITATATPDNILPSLAYVPGRTLCGGLANWLIGQDRRDAAALLAEGRLSVSDALPIPHKPKNFSQAEVLPAPLALRSEKPPGASGSIPWWAQTLAPARRFDGTRPGPTDIRLRRPESDLFVFRDGPDSPWSSYRPQMRIRLRNGRPEPDQPDPSLFAVEQIAEETLFWAEIRGSEENLQAVSFELEPVLNGRRWLRIGRGGNAVEVLQWAYTDEPAPSGPLKCAFLTLTSDLLVRDEYLRWRTRLDEDGLISVLGPSNDLKVAHDDDGKPFPTVQEATAVHGFNGTARLWRMPAYGIRRGSVFVIEGEGIEDVQKRIGEGRWLGERTHDGFGRFRLDKDLPGLEDGAAQIDPPPQTQDDPADAIATTTRHWFEQHKNLANTDGATVRPSLSQWFALVADLESGASDALSARLDPKTMGARNWKGDDAVAILQKLRRLPDASDRANHARMFVRWLRAKIRSTAQ